MKLAYHLSTSEERYTPRPVIERVERVFGGPIDCDPASCEQANTIVRARVFYTKRENGLTLPWFGNVFVNPPGGRVIHQGVEVNQPGLWWATLSQRFALRGSGMRVRQAAFVIFNLETLRHAQAWACRQPLDFSTVIFSDRLDYLGPSPTGPVPLGSPPHPSALVYLGRHIARFRAVFEPCGFVSPPR